MYTGNTSYIFTLTEKIICKKIFSKNVIFTLTLHPNAQCTCSIQPNDNTLSNIQQIAFEDLLHTAPMLAHSEISCLYIRCYLASMARSLHNVTILLLIYIYFNNRIYISYCSRLFQKPCLTCKLL